MNGGKNKSKKKLVYEIFILIVIIIILLIILFVLTKRKTNIDENTAQINTSISYEIDDKNDDILDLSGFEIFYNNYTGVYRSSEIAYKLECITTEYIPEMMEEINSYDDDKLKIYYSERSNIIKGNYGITSEEIFIKFAKSLISSKLDMSTWYRLDIDTDTFKDISSKDQYAYVEYDVIFLNNEKVRFSLYVGKTLNQKPSYIIDVID